MFWISTRISGVKWSILIWLHKRHHTHLEGTGEIVLQKSKCDKFPAYVLDWITRCWPFCVSTAINMNAGFRREYIQWSPTDCEGLSPGESCLKPVLKTNSQKMAAKCGLLLVIVGFLTQIYNVHPFPESTTLSPEKCAGEFNSLYPVSNVLKCPPRIIFI